MLRAIGLRPSIHDIGHVTISDTIWSCKFLEDGVPLVFALIALVSVDVDGLLGTSTKPICLPREDVIKVHLLWSPLRLFVAS